MESIGTVLGTVLAIVLTGESTRVGDYKSDVEYIPVCYSCTFTKVCTVHIYLLDM